MNRILMPIFFLAFFTKASIAQDSVKSKSFLGFGWVVSISNDIIFVPSESMVRAPEAKDFFSEERKVGFRVEFLNSAFKSLDFSKTFSIRSESGESSTLKIVPVIASYKVLGGDQVYFMKRIYSHGGRRDSVEYRFGLDMNIDVRAIEK